MDTPPSITSFSPDSAIIGDGITNKNTLTLTGTAAANTTVKVYDGTTLLGSATTNSSGAWDFTTGKLSDGGHSFTAATTVASSSTTSGFPNASTTGVRDGVTLTPSGDVTINTAGAVVSGLDITGDVVITAPNVKLVDCRITGNVSFESTGATMEYCDVIGHNSLNAVDINPNGRVGQGDNTTIRFSDISNAENGIWLEGQHAIIEGNYIHNLSNNMGVPPDVAHIDGIQVPGSNIGATPLTSGTIIHNTIDMTSFPSTSAFISRDASNIEISNNLLKGGAYTVYFLGHGSGNEVSNNTFDLAGAYGYVEADPGTTTLGGNIDTRGALLPINTDGAAIAGSQVATSTATETSAPLLVKVDTAVPSAPTIVASTSAADLAKTHVEALKGTAEANSTVTVFDGTTKIGTATADANGAWSYSTKALSVRSHSFTATATDVAGNTGTASSAAAVTVSGSTPTQPPSPDPTPSQPTPTDPGHSGSEHRSQADGFDFTSLWQSRSGFTKIHGTANAGDAVKFYDGSTFLGSVTAGADGSWTFAKSLSKGVHTITAKEVDSSGHVVSESSGAAITGSTRSDTLTGTTGNDRLLGKGGDDTFVFAANFGKDVIKDFDAIGRHHDTLQFSKSVFDSFASVLDHATQAGNDVVISSGSDTLTLKNVKLSALDSHDFHFV
ncbi:Ig-like domain-containing protein [Mesorhizobium sp. WSM3224]|uniref:Ig-like domain-containing protein n=1 Tax=Mesorhizobium sp. WSM3224 TaxID=1040986 RepID=UPI000488203F|nr:Ig-like domain-containing protein [Mesorhizobium sp. WSM3224]